MNTQNIVQSHQSKLFRTWHS